MYYDKKFWDNMNSNLDFAQRMNRRAKLKWFIAKPFAYSILALGRFHLIDDNKPIRSRIARKYVAFVFRLMQNAKFASKDVTAISKAIDFTYQNYVKNLNKRYRKEDEING